MTRRRLSIQAVQCRQGMIDCLSYMSNTMESIDSRHVFAMLCQSYYLAVMIKAYLELLHLTFWMAVSYPNCAHFLHLWGLLSRATSDAFRQLLGGFLQTHLHCPRRACQKRWSKADPIFSIKLPSHLPAIGGVEKYLEDFWWWNLNGTGWHRMKHWKIPTRFGQLALQMNYWSVGKQWGCMWRMVDGQIFNRVCWAAFHRSEFRT